MTTLIDKTKPNGTSAATTAFCAHKLEGPDGRYLWIDGNGKITAGNGTLDDPKPNAFSLIEISDCPGSTETCRRACYVHALAQHAPETHKLYVHNSNTIRDILDDRIGIVAAWAITMGQYIEQNCKGGFRWHVSGDIFSSAYAYWIAHVVRNSPNVRHWIYTRSFDFVEALIPVSTRKGGNLAINLSADKNNYMAAVKASMVHSKRPLRICYLCDDGNIPEFLTMDGDVIFPDYALRGGTQRGQEWFAGLPPEQKSYVCPVDYHGKAENRRCGPCDRCLK